MNVKIRLVYFANCLFGNLEIRYSLPEALGTALDYPYNTKRRPLTNISTAD